MMILSIQNVSFTLLPNRFVMIPMHSQKDVHLCIGKTIAYLCICSLISETLDDSDVKLYCTKNKIYTNRCYLSFESKDICICISCSCKVENV